LLTIFASRSIPKDPDHHALFGCRWISEFWAPWECDPILSLQFAILWLGFSGAWNVTSYGCCWGHASSSAVVVVVVREILVLKPETKKKCRENTQLGIERTNKHCKTEFIQR
jgi:hypothetical protein